MEGAGGVRHDGVRWEGPHASAQGAQSARYCFFKHSKASDQVYFFAILQFDLYPFFETCFFKIKLLERYKDVIFSL